MTYICAPIFVTIPRDNGISVDFQPTGGVEVAIPSGPKGLDGVSPTIEVTDILGGHKVTITDVNGTEDFNVMDGGISESDFLKVFPTDTASGAVATFPDGADQVPLKTLTVAIEPVQSGSGDPSPDNVRPITGWTEATVTRTGANVWDEEWELGSISDTTGQNITNNNCIRSKNYIPVLAETNYYFRCDGWGTNNNVRTRFYDASKNYLGYAQYGGSAVNKNTVFKTPANCAFMRFASPDVYGTTYNHNISINYPSTDHDYHAYSGNTYTIDLNGTRYGGTLDVLTGVLTVDREEVDGGSLTWTKVTGNSYRNFTATPSRAPKYLSVRPTVMSSQYVGECNDSAPSTGDNYVWIRSGGVIAVKDTGKAALTENEFKTAMTGVQFVYELAVTLTVQLTAQQVSSLLGANNVWADTGNVSVVYRADIGLFIDKKLNA